MQPTKLNGVLEIDHDRGVIYFHLSDEKEVLELRVATPLRICRLPRPIPEVKGRSLDITHMHGCDWGRCVCHEATDPRPQCTPACDEGKHHEWCWTYR